jgi:calmodulin
MDEPVSPGLEELKRKFDAIDANGDGRIEVAEFHELLMDIDGDVSREECELDFLAIDLNDDGYINFEEFRAWWLG